VAGVLGLGHVGVSRVDLDMVVVVVVVDDLDGDGDVEVDATVDVMTLRELLSEVQCERGGRLLEGVVAMGTKML
jgi:hypothetical protein